MTDRYRKTIPLSEIVIPATFRDSHPTPEKVEAKRDAVTGNDPEARDKVLRSIWVTADGILLDGYISYLVMKDLGFTEADCKIIERCPVAFAHMPGRYKNYAWKISKDCAFLRVGDHIAVRTSQGIRHAIVSRVSSMTLDEAKDLKDVVGRWNYDGEAYV